MQAIQSDQPAYQVEVPSELGRVNELLLAVLEAEKISLSTCYIYLRMGRYGPKAFIANKLVELFPHGQYNEQPYWYMLICPGKIYNNFIYLNIWVLHDLYICISDCCAGNYGNRRLCDKMFESTRTKFPAPILRRSELQNLANYAVNSDNTDSNTIGIASFGNITNQPRVSFNH